MKPAIFALLVLPLLARAGVDNEFNQAEKKSQNRAEQSAENAQKAQENLDQKQIMAVASQVAGLLGTSVAAYGKVTSADDIGRGSDGTGALTVKVKTRKGQLCEIQVLDVDLSCEKYPEIDTPLRLPALRALCGETAAVREVERSGGFFGSSAALLGDNFALAMNDCNASIWNVDVSCYDAKGNAVDNTKTAFLEALRTSRGVRVYNSVN